MPMVEAAPGPSGTSTTRDSDGLSDPDEAEPDVDEPEPDVDEPERDALYAELDACPADASPTGPPTSRAIADTAPKPARHPRERERLMRESFAVWGARGCEPTRRPPGISWTGPSLRYPVGRRLPSITEIHP